MTDFVPSEVATVIRQPSTALFLVDSSDRKQDLSGGVFQYFEANKPWNMLINNPNALMNGFFTRLSLTELAIRWDVPNISADFGNTTLLMDISGYGSNPITITLPNQFATAACAFDAIMNSVNDLSGTTNFFLTMLPRRTAPCIYQLIGNNKAPGTNGGFFKFRTGVLSQQLNATSTNLTKFYEPTSPDLRPFSFIDFTSQNLTYNQDLKDSTTNPVNVDIIQRFYFAYEQENTYDKYNFPILMGYRPFVVKQQYNPPKQIRWSPQQPIGQVQFEVYGKATPGYVAASVTATRQPQLYSPLTNKAYLTNYQFTLQVSEN